MAESKAAKTEVLIYKGHPLRRVDNFIYYGTMADKYIIMMQILETKKEQDLDVATKVSVQLQMTDPDLKSRDRVVKKSEKDSLYAAMDVAAIWLDRALSGRRCWNRGWRHHRLFPAAPFRAQYLLFCGYIFGQGCRCFHPRKAQRLVQGQL